MYMTHTFVKPSCGLTILNKCELGSKINLDPGETLVRGSKKSKIN